MSDNLKTALDTIHEMMNNFNRGKYANEQAFLDDIKPIVSEIKEELEKPEKKQATIEE